MGKNCVNCGVELRGGTRFCPGCGEPISEISSSLKSLRSEIISDLKRSQQGLKTVREIQELLRSEEAKFVVKWGTIKKWAILLLVVNVVLLFTFSFLGGQGVVPVVFFDYFYLISFILSFVFICIYGTISLSFKSVNERLSFGTTSLLYRDYEEALESYIGALRRSPSEISAWRGLGYLYLSVREFSEAVEACKIGLEIDPDDMVLWWILFSVYRKVGEGEKAKEAWGRLSEGAVGGEISLQIRAIYPYFQILKSPDFKKKRDFS